MTTPPKTHALSPEEVARKTGGVVVYYPPYNLDNRTMVTGYKTLRRTVLWASRETGRPVPKTVQETLRWLRDTFVKERRSYAIIERSETCSAPVDTHSESTPSTPSTEKGGGGTE